MQETGDLCIPSSLGGGGSIEGDEEDLEIVLTGASNRKSRLVSESILYRLLNIVVLDSWCTEIAFWYFYFFCRSNYEMLVLYGLLVAANFEARFNTGYCRILLLGHDIVGPITLLTIRIPAAVNNYATKKSIEQSLIQ